MNQSISHILCFIGDNFLLCLSKALFPAKSNCSAPPKLIRNNEMSNYGSISITHQTHQFLCIIKLDQWVIISLRIVK